MTLAEATAHPAPPGPHYHTQAHPGAFAQVHTSPHAVHTPQDEDHVSLIPLVESALAVMRLSCEKFFVLVRTFLLYMPRDRH
jgi:hypothetical protein